MCKLLVSHELRRIYQSRLITSLLSDLCKNLRVICILNLMHFCTTTARKIFLMFWQQMQQHPNMQITLWVGFDGSVQQQQVEEARCTIHLAYQQQVHKDH